MPRELWTLDCETDPFMPGRVPEPFVWGVFTGKDFVKFPTAEKMLDFLVDKPVVCYAHNGGRFDYHYLLEYLEPGARLDIINGRLAKFRIGDCEFRDSFNILPVPLSAYQKTKIDYSIFESEVRHKNGNYKRIVSYLKDDCIYLYELVSQFIEQYGHSLTMAGASMKTWERMEGAKAPESDADFYDQFYPWYFGGRVECFERGDIVTDFRVVDINSAYPYAMMSAHPFGLRHIQCRGTNRKTIDGPSFYIVECKSRGAFPTRQSDGRLAFPADNETRQFRVTGWELQAAVDTGTAPGLSIVQRVRFEECRDFAGYVKHFYNARMAAKAAGDKAGTLFTKLLMNSLYGKFAANPRRYAAYIVGDPSAPAPFGMEAAGMIGPHPVMRRDLFDDEQRFYNIATAASVTGFVRAHLWRAINRCKGVLYCDTDSIAARDTFSVSLGAGLGEWDLEGEFSRACIAGKKLYAFKRYGKLSDGQKRWKVASKGVNLSHRQIERIANNETVMYQPQVPTYSVYKAPQFTPRNIRLTDD